MIFFAVYSAAPYHVKCTEYFPAILPMVSPESFWHDDWDASARSQSCFSLSTPKIHSPVIMIMMMMMMMRFQRADYFMPSTSRFGLNPNQMLSFSLLLTGGNQLWRKLTWFHQRTWTNPEDNPQSWNAIIKKHCVKWKYKTPSTYLNGLLMLSFYELWQKSCNYQNVSSDCENLMNLNKVEST